MENIDDRINLIAANALYSDAKFNNIIKRFISVRKKIEGDKILYINEDNPIMKATFYPLFEIEGDNFRTYIDGIPRPNNEDEKNALIAYLYTKYYFIDCLEEDSRVIYIGLNDVEMFDEATISVLDDISTVEHKEDKLD